PAQLILGIVIARLDSVLKLLRWCPEENDAASAVIEHGGLVQGWCLAQLKGGSPCSRHFQQVSTGWGPGPKDGVCSVAAPARLCFGEAGAGQPPWRPFGIVHDIQPVQHRKRQPPAIR